MNTNKEKFLNIVAEKDNTALAKTKERIQNREWLKESQEIAIKVLEKLEELKWSQRKLAKKMDVSPQQVSKLVRGKENLTLATQKKLQTVLNIPILATFYEQKFEEIVARFETEFTLEIPRSFAFSEEYNILRREEKELKFNYKVSHPVYTNYLKIA